MAKGFHGCEILKWIGRCGRDALRGVGARKRNSFAIKAREHVRELRIRAIGNVQQTEIEILAVSAAMTRFIMVLKPIDPDDVRHRTEVLQCSTRGGSALGLSCYGWKNALRVFVAARVFHRRHVELADEDGLAREPVQRVEVATEEGAIVPVRI